MSNLATLLPVTAVSFGLGLFHLSVYLSTLIKIDPRSKPLRSKSICFRLTDITKNQPKSEFYHGICYLNWYKWQEKEPGKMTFKWLLQKTQNFFLLITWLCSFYSHNFSFFFSINKKQYMDMLVSDLSHDTLMRKF